MAKLKIEDDKILDSPTQKYTTERNIDHWIEYASGIEKQSLEIQVMLTNYKYEHFKFDDPEKKFKL